LVKSGQTSEDLIYQKIVGLKDNLSGPQNTPAIFEDDDYHYNANHYIRLTESSLIVNILLFYQK